jgi:hypothetical protein
LGKVELGGWNMQYAWRNPPPQFLEKEIAPFSDWLIWYLLISPRLDVFDLKTAPLGDDNYHIQMVVHNTGWLPSYVTKKALEKKAVMRGVICEIELPEGAILKAGKSRQDIGQLEGRAYTPSAISVWGGETSTADRAKVEWVVHAPDGGEAVLTARHSRAGTVRRTVKLG